MLPEPLAVIGHPLWLHCRRRSSHQGDVCCPSPEPAPHWRTAPVQPRIGIGRDEGTDKFLGRRGQHCRLSALTIAMVSEPPYVCGAATRCLHPRPEMKSDHAT
jgi:hypothetical protein